MYLQVGTATSVLISYFRASGLGLEGRGTGTSSSHSTQNQTHMPCPSTGRALCPGRHKGHNMDPTPSLCNQLRPQGPRAPLWPCQHQQDPSPGPSKPLQAWCSLTCSNLHSPLGPSDVPNPALFPQHTRPLTEEWHSMLCIALFHWDVSSPRDPGALAVFLKYMLDKC